MLKRASGSTLRASSTGSSPTSPRRRRSPRCRAGGRGCRTASGREWDEPYRTSYPEYVAGAAPKDAAVRAVREAVGRVEDYQQLPPGWLNGLKLHAATLPLAEFAAVVGNLRARALRARQRVADDGDCSARWTRCATRRSRSLLMHELVRWDPQFDWTHKLLPHQQLGRDRRAPPRRRAAARVRTPIEFAIATNFVFETGFTNLQFVGLSALAHGVGDKMFEKMVGSIQSDEARHAQIGAPGARHRREARSRATRSTCSTSGSGAAGCCSRS